MRLHCHRILKAAVKLYAMIHLLGVKGHQECEHLYGGGDTEVWRGQKWRLK